jgi:hypothetical protein
VSPSRFVDALEKGKIGRAGRRAEHYLDAATEER